MLGAFFAFVLLIFIGLSLFEGKLKKQIVSFVNESLQGEVIVHHIEYTLISSYPKAHVKIDSIFVYETKANITPENLILAVYNFDIMVDVREIINGNYLIDELSIASGEVHIISYADSTLNLTNLLTESLETEEEGGELSLSLNKIKIDSFYITYEDQLTNQYLYSKLDRLNSNITLEGDELIGNIDLEFQLDSMLSDGKRAIKNHRLALSSNFTSNLDSLSFTITNGAIKFNLLEANINGYYNDLDSGFIDIRITANHKELHQLAKMEVFKAENLPDIRSGELSIDAHITGKTKGELPIIEAYANLRNLQVYNSYGKMIEQGGFSLKLVSNSTTNMMESTVVVDSIQIIFATGGFFKGRAEVTNFETPSFNLDWKVSENLEELHELIDISEVKKMNGHIESNGSISGKFNLKNNTLVSHKGAAMVSFKDVNIVLNQSNYPITHLNGSVYLMNGDAGLDEIGLNANGNIINLSARINNLVPFVLGKPAQLLASMSIKSESINTQTLLAFDPELADSTKYKIDNIDVAIMANFSSSAIDKYELIPTGKIDINNFTALVEGAPPIVDFSGKIEIAKDLIAIKDFSGIIGKSHVGFSVNVSNYADYFQTETIVPMIVDVSLTSENANAKDFFTINHQFVLPKNYEEEVLKNVVINAKIITTNTELQKRDLLPEFELQMTGLQFQTLHSPVVFKDIFVFGLVKDNNVYINSMFGKFGRSDVFMNAQFDNVLATKDTISRPMKSRISFNAGVLDLNELVKLDEVESVEDSVTSTEVASNPFADDFPVIDFQVNIGELVYYDAVIKNIHGIIKIEENNIIQMQQVSLESGEFGSFEFDGTLDASSGKEAILKSTIKISNVDLANLNVKYVQGDEEVKISDHFEGMINGSIVADVPILPDFSFDLARLTGKVKVKMTDGALINYAPLEEMGNYFKNKDLNYIEFDELKNIIIFNRGKMLLPFMTINTTLGTINLMGFQSIEGDMNYDIQVPIKLVAGSALNAMFSSKKGDDSKKDEMKKGGKGKYVTVHISSKGDEFNIKLGKKNVLTAPPGFSVD